MSHLSAKEKILLVALFLLAAFFRVYNLDQFPPGFQFDQAFYVFDVLWLLQGHFQIFFAAPGGAEPLFPYLAMPFVAIFGAETPLGLKLTGAVIGALTIPALYVLARALFNSKRIAAFAAFFAAISFWHIFFNRFGERVTLLTLITILLFIFYWRALSSRSIEYRQHLFAGVMLALALYTYPGSRVLPFALLFLTTFAIITDRSRARFHLRGIAITLAIAAILFFPLGLYFLQHPADFIGHTAQVSIFVPHAGETGDVPAALARNAAKIAGMFFIAGDPGALRNLPGRPVFDPFSAVFFVAGALALLAALFSPRSTRLARLRAGLIAVWIGAMLSISLLSDDAPNFARTLPAMPAVMILPAWGATQIIKLSERSRSHSPLVPCAHAPTGFTQYVSRLAIVALCAFSAFFSFRDYFITFANDPGTYYAFDGDKMETARWLNFQSPSHQLYLAPLLSTNGTISLLTRTTGLKSFDSRDTIVLPSNHAGKDALYVFPWEQERRVETMLARLGKIATRENVLDRNGGVLLYAVRVPAAKLPDSADAMPALIRASANDGAFLLPQKTDRANFGGQIELLGLRIESDGASGRNPVVVLFARALTKMERDYSFSVKLRGAQERVWGQEDKWLGDNSYATSVWDVGDVVIEKFYPGLDACAPAGEYRASLEIYEPKTGDVLSRTNGDDNIALLGTMTAGASEGNRLEDLDPEKPADVRVADGIELFGYSLLADPLQAGQEFSLSLFWRGAPNARARDVRFYLRDSAARDYLLTTRAIALPGDGRGLCTLVDGRIAADAAKGNAALYLNDAKIADVVIR
ncbi:MAG: glycosyltransferase family 39 protein [Chloroflexi bacterium]|nr:glycosyltransferase family 39 protein [Chloroflexota bacterium]